MNSYRFWDGYSVVDEQLCSFCATWSMLMTKFILLIFFVSLRTFWNVYLIGRGTYKITHGKKVCKTTWRKWSIRRMSKWKFAGVKYDNSVVILPKCAAWICRWCNIKCDIHVVISMGEDSFHSSKFTFRHYLMRIPALHIFWNWFNRLTCMIIIWLKCFCCLALKIVRGVATIPKRQ